MKKRTGTRSITGLLALIIMFAFTPMNTNASGGVDSAPVVEAVAEVPQEAPAAEAPAVEEPATEALTVETLAAEAPAIEVSAAEVDVVAEAPASENVVVEAPVNPVEAPVYENTVVTETPAAHAGSETEVPAAGSSEVAAPVTENGVVAETSPVDNTVLDGETESLTVALLELAADAEGEGMEELAAAFTSLAVDPVAMASMTTDPTLVADADIEAAAVKTYNARNQLEFRSVYNAENGEKDAAWSLCLNYCGTDPASEGVNYFSPDYTKIENIGFNELLKSYEDRLESETTYEASELNNAKTEERKAEIIDQIKRLMLYVDEKFEKNEMNAREYISANEVLYSIIGASYKESVGGYDPSRQKYYDVIKDNRRDAEINNRVTLVVYKNPEELGKYNSNVKKARIQNLIAAVIKPLAGNLVMEGTKELIGRDMIDGEFTFTIMEDDKVIATGANNADGKITFTEINYVKEDLGDHVYTIAEEQGNADGVTYDSTKYNVDVRIENVDGVLVAKYELPDGVKFSNSYENPEKPKEDEPEKTIEPEQPREEQPEKPSEPEQPREEQPEKPSEPEQPREEQPERPSEPEQPREEAPVEEKSSVLGESRDQADEIGEAATVDEPAVLGESRTATTGDEAVGFVYIVIGAMSICALGLWLIADRRRKRS